MAVRRVQTPQQPSLQRLLQCASLRVFFQQILQQSSLQMRLQFVHLLVFFQHIL